MLHMVLPMCKGDRYIQSQEETLTVLAVAKRKVFFFIGFEAINEKCFFTFISEN